MMPPTAPPPAYDAVVAWGIGGLAWLVAAVLVGIWRRYLPASAGTAALVLTAWLVATGAAAGSGVLARLDLVPPPAAVLIVSALALGLGVGTSATGARLADRVPLVVLIGFQGFRLPLEFVMHRAAVVGIMPPELTYTGYNLDIVTGATAVALAGAMVCGMAVPRAVCWLWNLWGLVCLTVIAAIAVASAPMVRAFGDDPRHINTWVLHLPYVWLPAVLVVVALAGHVVVARELLRRTATPPRT